MKRIQIILTSAVLLAAASCSSTRNVSSTPDDVYYSANDPQQYEPQPANAAAPPADYSRDNSNYNPDNNTNYSQSRTSTEQYSDDQGNTYITNNYNNDDYYDYEYSSRIRRYYTPAVGYGYYDPFYTNTYWYDYNPYNYGVSIYLGFNWWAPAFMYYSPFYYPPVYNPYYYPHYSCYTPCYGYYGSPYSPYGYNHGYNDGYWNGYNQGYYASAYNNPYYYNSYEGSSAYFGPRGSISSNVSTTSPSPRASLGEKYHKATEQVIPVMDTKSIVTAPLQGSGTERPNTSVAIDGGGRQNVSPVVPKNDVNGKTQVVVEPIRQSISDKNQNGTKPVVDPSAYTTGRNNTTSVIQTPRTSGGTVKPDIEQPTRSNNINNSRPGKVDVQPSTQSNMGGTVRPGLDQSGNNQEPRTNTTQPRNNQLSQPRNLDNNAIGQPRIENTNPRSVEPRVEPRIEQQRVNPSYERPRQEVQPKIEPRQEPRQYKQERSEPKQRESISTPSPRQQNTSVPSQRNNNSSGESKNGGRRK